MSASEILALGVAILTTLTSIVSLVLNGFAMDKATFGAFWLPAIFWLAYLRLRQIRIAEKNVATPIPRHDSENRRGNSK